LRAALQDTDVGVRINATRALGRIGHTRDLELLRSRPTDPSRAVRRAIREALDK
jgi:HEAT repeat protein